jgi:Caspase domain/WD domain, G-beta repeat
MNAPGTRDALIVAVSNYLDPKLRQLRAPAADATALRDVLSDPEIGNFRVEVLTDPDEGTLRRQLARFFSHERRPEDLLLVHFSCHGVKDETGELYLAAADTEQALLSGSAIPAKWLNDQINRCRSKRIVVLLDCCFSGSFPFGARARAGDVVNAPSQLTGRGRAVISSSNAMEYAYEGDQLTGQGRPSVFTQAVVQGLQTGEADRDHDQQVSVQDLYHYVYDHVKDVTPDQTPNMMSTLEGPLHLARSKYEPPVEPAELDPDLISATNSDRPYIRRGAVEELAQLVRSVDRSVVLAARQALERLADDDSRAVCARATEVLAKLVSPAPPPSENKAPRPPPAPHTLGESKLTQPGAESAPPSARGRPTRTLQLGGSLVGSLAFSPEGRLAIGVNTMVEVWDVHTSAQLWFSIAADSICNVSDVAFSPDGNHLATVSHDAKARIWDAATGETLRIIKHPNRWWSNKGALASVAFSPDGNHLATAGNDAKTRIWDAATGETLRTLEHPAAVTGVAFSPNGNHLATACDDANTRIWDAATGETLRTLEHAKPVNDVAFSPGGNHLATACDDAKARIWDTATGETVGTLEHPKPVKGVAFSPDGNHLVTACKDKRARIWAAGTE